MSLTKEQILDAIRSCAKENGGQPLGHVRFTAETGIRYADWHGIYWARWGDALRDAGFLPNALQTAFPEDSLIERYIALTRELGHLPVKGELRIKRRTDGSFPNDKVFFGRFGSKAALIAKVLEHCRQQPGFEDVIALCMQVVPAPVEVQSQRSGATDLNNIPDGYVYLAKSGRYHKIGRSNSTGRREYELAIQLPERIDFIHRIRTDDPVGIESYWHKRFESKRAKGEWFTLDPVDVFAFKRRKSFM